MRASRGLNSIASFSLRIHLHGLRGGTDAGLCDEELPGRAAEQRVAHVTCTTSAVRPDTRNGYV